MTRRSGDGDVLDQIELWNQEDAAELRHPADLGKHEITVSSRDWTVGTIVRQIEQQNIDLEPAFQRRNAWRDHRRSRLIESFVLGFPVPQIVLAENPRKKGTFIVIDGKQRLLTIAGLHLPNYRNYWAQTKFSGLAVLEDLNGVSLDAFLQDPSFLSQRRQLENADIRTTVITGFRDEDVLYDIFYRINTGSVPLSSQELRQVLNRGAFAKFMLDQTTEKNPLWTILAIDAPDARLRDVELLLRLIAWRMFSNKYTGNMKPFLDETMKKLNTNWPSQEDQVRQLVRDLFKGIEAAVDVFGDDVGRKFKNGEYERALNRAMFEVQAYYLSFSPVRSAAVRKKKALKDASMTLAGDKNFVASIESTTKSIENYRTRFGKYQQMLQKALGVSVEPLRLSSGH